MPGRFVKCQLHGHYISTVLSNKDASSVARKPAAPSTRQCVPSNIGHGRCLQCTSADRFIVTEGRRGMGVYLRKQAFSILNREGRPELIKKDGGEMLVSIVLDRPLDDAKAPSGRPGETHLGNHGNTRKQPIAPSAGPNGKSGRKGDLPLAEFTAASSSSGFGPPRRATQADDQQDRFQ